MGYKLLTAVLVLALLSGCGAENAAPAVTETADPYAGMVQVKSGYGTKIWVNLYEELEVNPLRETVVAASEEIRDENGQQYEMRIGIDISEHQGEIDWAALSTEQPDFALIRAAYRGYGESGKLCQDTCFEKNVQGALEYGIPVGLYFFSQAISREEAVEEAEYLLELLKGYSPAEFKLPIFFDWENIGFEEARTDHVDGKTLTDCALAFCRRMEEAGYTAGIYAYRSLAYFSYDLPQIADYPLWIGALGECPDYYYAFDIWQYSTEGTLPGITGPVDMDAVFLPIEEEQPEAS